MIQSGFQAAVSPVLQLDVNQTATQDFHLQVGAATQTVNVTASAELLQSSTTELGTVIEQKTVNDLPLNGRSFSALLTLAPGVNPVNYSQNSSVGYTTGLGPPASRARHIPSHRRKVNGTGRICGIWMASATHLPRAVPMIFPRSLMPYRGSKSSPITIRPNLARVLGGWSI